MIPHRIARNKLYKRPKMRAARLSCQSPASIVIPYNDVTIYFGNDGTLL